LSLEVRNYSVRHCHVGRERQACEHGGGHSRGLSGGVDEWGHARLRFANGCIANLTASRISRDRVRKIRFFQPATYVSIDYAAQKVDLWRVTQQGGPMPSIEGGEVPVVNEEPLGRELADFVDAAVTRRPPLVTGEDGRRALAVAESIADKIRTATKTRNHETD
jgi:predicted dehydrogenase